MNQETRRKTLIILNDPPYGTERSYNGLRLANALSKDPQDEVRVFLTGGGVLCAKRGQQTPNDLYNLELMLNVASRQGVSVGAWGSCLDARGIGVDELAEGVHRGSLEELVEWTRWAGKVVTF